MDHVHGPLAHPARIMNPLPHEKFEALVREAIGALPQEFLSRLDNVDIVVEDDPTPEQLQHNGVGPEDTLYGLYEGIPLTQRQYYSMVMPDRIFIFKRPLEDVSDTIEDLTDNVQTTVVHEIAHFFGISDETLEEMGLG